MGLVVRRAVARVLRYKRNLCLFIINNLEREDGQLFGMSINIICVISGFNVLPLHKLSLNKIKQIKNLNMRKIKISLMFLALLFVGVLPTKTSFARKPAPEKSPDITQLNKLLTKLVQYPDFTLNDKEDDVEIYVTFMLGDDGKIKIEKVTAPSQRLEDYVTEKLSGVTANYVIHPYDQHYKVQIRFN
jgi:hypothetical protein